jgi:hypothetical protein
MGADSCPAGQSEARGRRREGLMPAYSYENAPGRCRKDTTQHNSASQLGLERGFLQPVE